jgi:hypothetical protein
LDLGSPKRLDPESKSLLWIRIGPGFNGIPGFVSSGSKRGKMPQKIENSPEAEISSFEMLDVLFYGLKASLVAWTS